MLHMRKQTLSGILGVLAAFVIGALVLALQGFNPVATYGALFQYSLFSASGFTADRKSTRLNSSH